MGLSWVARAHPKPDGVTFVAEDPDIPDLPLSERQLADYAVGELAQLPGWGQDGMRVLLTPTDMGEYIKLDITELDENEN